MTVKENMYKHNDNLSKYATKDSEAYRYFQEEKEDIRTPFFRDIDRIIYSLSYTRYMDNTQVFSFNENDHISKRMVHVQFVSKIARTIGRALGLNEDLIEAASLGHDLGHVPFGHVGEHILNEISLNNNEGYFNHNVQSFRTLYEIENSGLGRNITAQVLDAIICHNGEFLQGEYKPKAKTFDDILNEYKETYTNNNVELIPMTLEGCVVRISDLIGYIGRDIEDAIRIGIIDKESIPKNITDVLGTNNREIVNTIILDIIDNSFDKPYIKLSDKVYNAIKELKEFNYINIYDKANTKEDIENYKKMFNELFEKYLNDLNTENKDSSIYRSYISNMNDKYKEHNTNARIVIDYIAGMTDDYFIREYKKNILDK